MNGTFSDYQSVVVDILQANDMPIYLPLIESAYQERKRVKSIPFEKIDEEILQTLSLLKNREVKIGLISNCTPEEVESWEACELPKYFDDIIFSYQEKCCKPYSDIYLKACNHLEVHPSDAIFVGDGGSNELQGAANVGMIAYQAMWFLPNWKRNGAFPAFNRPLEIINVINR